MHDLVKVLSGFGSPNVVLVGDFMLDRYVHGDVERISPEAPVAILRTIRTTDSAGGAGNVAAAAAAMGAKVSCVGVVGKDADGRTLRKLLSDIGAGAEGLLDLSPRTAVKTRYVGLAQHRHGQQMLRVDDESPQAPAGEAAGALQSALTRAIGAGADIVVFEDYNKGVCGDDLTPKMIASAKAAGKTVIVDPAAIADYRRYRGATVIKPNRYEASLASGLAIDGDASIQRAAAKLADVTGASFVVITLDREGAYLYLADGGSLRIPHNRPRDVYDVTGAGDQTLAVLAVALAQKCPCRQAVELANIAGGLEVERAGFEPVTRREVVNEIYRMMGLRGDKVTDRQRLARELQQRRDQGGTIVFTNGCFDLLHMGHVRYLRQARELGSCLVVAINSDDSVRRLKGPPRPVIGQDERAEMLGSLESVDYVTVFDEDTPVELLKLLKPDILAKGGSTDVVVGREIVEAYGGKVLTLELVQGLSTTEIINRILDANGR